MGGQRVLTPPTGAGYVSIRLPWGRLITTFRHHEGQRLETATPASGATGRYLPYVAGGAAVLAIGIGIGAVLGQDDPGSELPAVEADGEPRVQEEAADVSLAPGDGVDAGPDASSRHGSLRWEAVVDDPAWADGRERQSMRDLVYRDGTVTGVGGGMGDVVVFSSTDGLAWSRYPDLDGNLADFTSQAHAATTAQPGLVAVGRYRGLEHSHDTAGVWVSEDGSGWHRLDDDTVFEAAAPAEMHGVADTRFGIIAVGFEGHVFVGDPWAEAAVWRSPDGRSWERMSDDLGAFGGAGVQRMHDVVDGGPGLIAVGVDDDPQADRRAAVWTYADGGAWERVAANDPAFDGPGSLEMFAITAFEGGYVAVGQGGDGSAGVWTSPDGQVWERVPDDPDNLEGEGTPTMLDVARVGEQLVAVGFEHLPGRHSVAAAWRSQDAISWERIVHQPALFDQGTPTYMTSVVALEDRIVAAGYHGDGSVSLHPIVWLAR